MSVNGLELGTASIRRGIFQRDSLSALLFVMALFLLSVILHQTNKGYQLSNGLKVLHLSYLEDLKLYTRSSQDIDLLFETKVV